MQFFLRFGFCYLSFGLGLVALLRDAPGALAFGIISDVPQVMNMFLGRGWWALAAFGALAVLLPRAELIRRIPRAIVALAGCSVLFLTFTMVKTTLPSVVPFWADATLARIDRALHFVVGSMAADPRGPAPAVGRHMANLVHGRVDDPGDVFPGPACPVRRGS